MKRAFDITISMFIMFLTMPVMVLIALWIRLESKGPVIFMQKRIGLNGEVFFIYKFRSMIFDAEKQGPYFTQKKDSRITKAGNFIRKTSLDELPQLYNVIKGEMSLVGPRPNVPEQRTGYTEEQWVKRNSVRPGITGLAQAMLRSAATADQRTDLDLEYINKASFSYDLWVMKLTIKQLVSKGSH